MEETGNPEDAALSLSDSGPLVRVRDPGGLESEGLTLRSGSILRGRTPHASQMSDSQALTEFDMVTVQGQTGLSPSERETVTSYTVSAAAAELSRVYLFICYTSYLLFNYYLFTNYLLNYLLACHRRRPCRRPTVGDLASATS